jgi:DHA1 family tetracycline resistance protein-like MFS transporter
MNNKRTLFSIFLVVFIDLLGFSIILPLLPYYAETFGADELEIGLLVAIYAAAQMISAPLLGRLSDRIGRRPVLLVSIAGNLIGFLMLGFAQNLWMLFTARLLAGLTGGNISVAQAYITDITDEKNRARGLGLIGAAFGLGFIIGPAIGGILSQNGFSIPAFVAAGFSLLNLLVVSLWLGESLNAERRLALAGRARPPFSVSALLNALKRPLVGPLLHTRFFFALAFSLFQSIFTLYALKRFGLESTQTGYILAYVGLISAITQGGLIRIFTQRFDERTLILSATIGMSIGLIGWGLAPNVPVLLIVLLPIAVAGGTLNTVLNSALSKSVQPIEIGGTLGLAASLESLTRVVAPPIGSALLKWVGSSAPGLLAGIFLIWLASYIVRHIHPHPISPNLPQHI